MTIISCSEKKTDIQNRFEKSFDGKLFKCYLQYRLTKSDSAKICHTGFASFDTLGWYYRSIDYIPVFSKRIFSENLTDTILYYFHQSENHGVSPSLFDCDYIKFLETAIIEKFYNDSIIDYSLLTDYELFISNSLLKYSQGMQYGFSDPTTLFSKSYFLPMKVQDSVHFFTILNPEKTISCLNGTARSERYSLLLSSLKSYKQIQEQGGWDSIIFTDPDIKIEYGDTSVILNSIAKRLIVTGELDTIYKSANYKTYDSTLFKAVKIYQTFNGLLNDGVIGRRTLEQMNVSVEERIDQIAVNLERFRWYNYPDTGKYIMINIPEYYLYGYNCGKKMISARVCVGEKISKNFEERMKRYLKTKKKWDKPENHETPCIYSRISHFILNPKWLVPKGITDKELIYKFIKDSNYIREQNYTILDDGEEINPDSVDWEKYKDGSVPFRLRQESGDLNALGRIKFIFPNKFDVYLHDTPSKAKFQSSYRAVSHGCIRIESPLKFAEYLISDDEKLHMDEIRLGLGLKPEDKEDEKKFKKRMEYYKENKDSADFGTETKTIMLKKRIPVYVDYYTAWVDSNGVLNFRMDVYERDKKILGKIR